MIRPVDRNDLKICYLDTELAFSIFYAYYQKKPQFLQAKNIKHHKFMPCAAWAWEHEKSLYSVSILDDKKRFKFNHRDDLHVAQKLFDVLQDADVIIGHNIDDFDMKEINTIFIKHRLGVLPAIKTIDTLKVARKYFRFEGNKLSELAAFFNVEGKDNQPDWQAVADGDVKALEYSEKYCKQDVKVLKKIFPFLRPFIRNFPTVPKNNRPEYCECCGSKLLKNHGTRFNGRSFYLDIRCLECKHPHPVKVKSAGTR